MASLLHIDVETDKNLIILHVKGDVDLYSSPELRKTLLSVLNNHSGTVVVDLEGVPYMDSSGVATLVEGLQLAEKQQRGYYLCGLSPIVQKVFELSRLDTVFHILSDLKSIKKEMGHPTP